METMSPEMMEHNNSCIARYAPIIEVGLDAKIATWNGFDCLIVAGCITADPEVWKRGMSMKKPGGGWPTPLEIVSTFTREEKLALRRRVAARSGWKIS
jgi:hypothetical protein